MISALNYLRLLQLEHSKVTQQVETRQHGIGDRLQTKMIVLLNVIILASLVEVEYGSAAVITYDDITYDDTCPTECLQTNQPHFTHGLKPFFLNCTVGNLAEVKHFRENYMKQFNDIVEPFDAPRLVGIDFYHKRFKNGHSEGALNISFQLHEGKAVVFKNTTGNNYRFREYKYTPAILLHFQSVDDPHYGDEFYYNNPRERIFRLWGPPLGPVTKRIGIHYDCIVGLDDSKSIRAYRIVLESAFGKTVTYNCTVAVQQGYDAGYTTEWRPTIATSFNHLNKTLHVVYSDFKRGVINETVRNISYSIQLLEGDGTVVRFIKKFNPTNFEILFQGLDDGSFVVKVEKCEVSVSGKFRNCISTTSVETEVTVT